MAAVLIFGMTLLLAVLLSSFTERTILSSAVIFLGVGFLSGDELLGFIAADPNTPALSRLAELALFAVLFTDGMRVDWKDLFKAWHLPTRALLVGLPLTLLLTAALAHFILGFAWIYSLLVGAILCPTDPVFASAIVGREEIPRQTKHLLNIESGINDGLALPFVLILMLSITGEHPHYLGMASELAFGVALGVAIPWLTSRLEQLRFFAVAVGSQPLIAVAVAIIIFAAAHVTNANEYLAAFSAGICFANLRSDLKDQFHRFGELIAELLKLAALMSFGALISPSFLRGSDVAIYPFAILALAVARPAALWVALLGTPLSRPEKLAVFWFGPKGFASVVYGLMILEKNFPGSEELFHAVALVIALSMVAHSSTDVPIARWFRKQQELNG